MVDRTMICLQAASGTYMSYVRAFDVGVTKLRSKEPRWMAWGWVRMKDTLALMVAKVGPLA